MAQLRSSFIVYLIFNSEIRPEVDDSHAGFRMVQSNHNVTAQGQAFGNYGGT